jgi:hypothetical protein
MTYASRRLAGPANETVNAVGYLTLEMWKIMILLDMTLATHYGV